MTHTTLARCVRAVALTAIASSAVACSYAFQKPQSNPTTTTSPVDIEVTWNADGRNFVATVDGVDSTAHFAVSGRRATARLNLSPGTHLVRAGGEIYCWYCSPKWYSNMQERTIVIPAPQLSVSVSPGTIQLPGSATATVTRPGTTGSLTVTLAITGNAVTFAGGGTSTSLSLAAGAASASTTINAVAAGQSTLTASAPAHANGTASVTVTAPPPPAPTITSLSPTSGPIGQSVVITGSNFTTAAQVRFASTNATSSFVSSTQLNATVPPGVSGQVNVTVIVAGQTSNSSPFTVTAPPANPADLLARASSSDVQVYDMNATPPLRVSAAATLSPGGLAGSAVGMSGGGGTGRLFRASTNDVQAFSVTAAGALGAPVQAFATQSTAIAIASSGNTIVRGHGTGLEVFTFSAGALQKRGEIFPSAGSGGVGVAISGTTAVRSTGTWFELIDISNQSSPTLLGSTGAASSSTGVAVVFTGPGRVVRAYDSGAELFDVSNSAAPVRLAQWFAPAGSLSSAPVAIAVAPGGRVVRATSAGIDVLTVGASSLTFAGSKNNAGDLSATGVGVTVSGNFAYRTTDDNIERYDITNPANIPNPKVATSAQHGVTQSSTGTAAVKP